VGGKCGSSSRPLRRDAYRRETTPRPPFGTLVILDLIGSVDATRTQEVVIPDLIRELSRMRHEPRRVSKIAPFSDERYSLTKKVLNPVQNDYSYAALHRTNESSFDHVNRANPIQDRCPGPSVLIESRLTRLAI